MIIAQHGNFTMIVKQNPSKLDAKKVDEKKEKKEEGVEVSKEVV